MHFLEKQPRKGKVTKTHQAYISKQKDRRPKTIPYLKKKKADWLFFEVRKAALS